MVYTVGVGGGGRWGQGLITVEFLNQFYNLSLLLTFDSLLYYITKTLLFKYVKNFTTKN